MNVSTGRWDKVIDDVEDHMRIAQTKFGDYASMHEAFGVAAEEFDEFFRAVQMRQSNPKRPKEIYDEAIDIAAVFIRIAEQAKRVLK